MLFIIFRGECEVLKDGEVVKTLKQGMWIGEEQLTDGIAAEFTVRAANSSANILSLDRGNFAAIVQAIRSMEKKANAGKSKWVMVRNKVNNHVDKEKLADEFLQKTVNKHNKQHLKEMELEHDVHRTERIGTLGEGSFGSVVLLKDSS